MSSSSSTQPEQASSASSLSSSGVERNAMAVAAAAAPHDNGYINNRPQPTLQDGLAFIHRIKEVFRDRPQVYQHFESQLAALRNASYTQASGKHANNKAAQEEDSNNKDVSDVIRNMYHWLEHNEALLIQFNCFLPNGYRIMILQENQEQPLAAYSVPEEPHVRFILGPTNNSINDAPSRNRQQRRQLQQQQDRPAEPNLIQPDED